MKSKIDIEIKYPTIITFLFYLAHAFFLPRLTVFLSSPMPVNYYQWPIRLVLENVGDPQTGKWLIVIFCVSVYFLSVFYGRKKWIQFLVVLTNLLYIAMTSFPILAVNANESFCFFYFSIALLFFNFDKKFFVDKYKVLMAIVVSPYVLSGLIKIYQYSHFLTDKTLFNRIIELEYFSHRSSFLVPFLKGHEFPTYPLLPLALLLQVSGIFAISSKRFRKIWIPSILFFHLSNSVLFNIHFFFSFLILPFSFFNSESEEDLEKNRNNILVLTFYLLSIFTIQNLLKLTTLALSERELDGFRIYSMVYMAITFAAIFLYKKNFMRMLFFISIIFNTVLLVTYNIPFSFPDHIILIILAFVFLKDPKGPLMEMKEWLLKAMTFIGGLRITLLTFVILAKLPFVNFPLEQLPRSFYLMAELPMASRWNLIVFAVIAGLEISYRKLSSKAWTLPLLLAAHLYLACFFYVTSSYYLFWVILITAMSNVKSSTTPNKWTIATCEG
ncbi:hypothetical protein DOM21_17310 [Bacteriovorax stolpii]|uniref:Uncharacterized protein n=1 Tax=Bacteriovorax stolpii TaxID=960 RepID=A0A2K9NN10_BACTC|nr:hypothetical protein [Bacteriovorax stolpii]AUN96890.1 hypothetical protein C0V70_01965 [Bacteriovorax stolpii]QDK43181.1 hypothetical protein DOM21_17310 [Bacteriovorax stolpii]TDP53168.1 hypothetical protein C8D79_1810 [Bacteriovorax stolpii]